MKIQFPFLALFFSLLAFSSDAQVIGGVIIHGGNGPYGRPYGRPYNQRYYRRPYYPPPPRPSQQRRQPPRNNSGFTPSVNLSIGYGFPNLDKNYLPEFIDAYKGTITQSGPINAAFDYQFSPITSIGVMGTYGKVSVPYYDVNSGSNGSTFTGEIKNWSVMFNMMTFIPTREKSVSPYLRTAIGINNWTQAYTYPDGTTAGTASDPTQLAYQVSLGARLNLSPKAGFYVEGGYGKYILNGGLTLKF